MSLECPDSKRLPARAYPKSRRTPKCLDTPTVNPESTPYIVTREVDGTCCPMYSNPPCISTSGPVPDTSGPCAIALGAATTAPNSIAPYTTILGSCFMVSPLHSDLPPAQNTPLRAPRAPEKAQDSSRCVFFLIFPGRCLLPRPCRSHRQSRGATRIFIREAGDALQHATLRMCLGFVYGTKGQRHPR